MSSSGANELLVLLEHGKRVLGSEMRPWAEFFGSLDQPKWNQADVKRRVEINLTFFRANYLIIVGIISAYHIIRSPGLLLVLVLCAVLYGGIFVTRRYAALSPVSMQGRLGAATVVSAILMYWSGYLFTFQWALFVGGVVSFAHALFRPPVARALAPRPQERSGNTRMGADLEGGGPGLSSGGMNNGFGGMGGLGGGMGMPGMGGDPFDQSRNLPANANVRLRTRPGCPIQGGNMSYGQPAPPALADRLTYKAR